MQPWFLLLAALLAAAPIAPEGALEVLWNKTSSYIQNLYKAWAPEVQPINLELEVWNVLCDVIGSRLSLEPRIVTLAASLVLFPSPGTIIPHMIASSGDYCESPVLLCQNAS